MIIARRRIFSKSGKERKYRIMGNMSFNFNKLQNSFFNVTLKNGDNLLVKMPMKKTMSKIQALQDMEGNEDISVQAVVDTLAGAVAEILSNNMTGKKVSAKEIADEYDLEEMKLFLADFYQKFVGKLDENPN